MKADAQYEYVAELAELSDIYRLAVLTPEGGQVRSLLAGRHAYMIASGGAAPAAILAADLHAATMGGTAQQLSPLAFVELARRPQEAVAVVFSARARHPDTALAIAHARAARLPVVLVTARKPHELPARLLEDQTSILTVPTTRPKDGFLATGSVLSMATCFAALYGASLPESLDSLPKPNTLGTDPLLVLHGSHGRAAAADVKIRLEELGLGSVEAVDYRDFAHGRHVGLIRRSDRAHLLALVTPESAAIAERTLKVIPDDIRVSRLTATYAGVAGSLQLLSAAMHIPLEPANSQNVSPARPRVPPFGRELYHLPFRKMYPVPVDSPLSRKAAAMGLAVGAGASNLQDAYSTWRRWVGQQQVRTVVLDYDGTCVTTEARYALPCLDVQNALLGLLRSGLTLAFASGRGRSLHRDLRKWVPEELHGQVILGLHNGTWLQQLAHPLTPNTAASEWVSELTEALEPYRGMGLISLRHGAEQLGIEPGDAGVPLPTVRAIVETAAAASGAPVQIVSSGHSVDVLPSHIGKSTFFADTQARFGTAIAIGDQGHPGGNDFSMLSATRLSLSVDRCSPALDRCWSIAKAGRTGPNALIDVAGMLQTRDGQVRLLPPAIKIGRR